MCDNYKSPLGGTVTTSKFIYTHRKNKSSAVTRSDNYLQCVSSLPLVISVKLAKLDLPDSVLVTTLYHVVLYLCCIRLEGGCTILLFMFTCCNNNKMHQYLHLLDRSYPIKTFLFPVLFIQVYLQYTPCHPKTIQLQPKLHEDPQHFQKKVN